MHNWVDDNEKEKCNHKDLNPWKRGDEGAPVSKEGGGDIGRIAI